VSFPIENGGSFHTYVGLPEGNSHVMGCHVDHISGRPSTVFPGAKIRRTFWGWPEDGPILEKIQKYIIWLVVLTILKNISQWEELSHILWKITNVWNHQPVMDGKILVWVGSTFIFHGNSIRASQRHLFHRNLRYSPEKNKNITHGHMGENIYQWEFQDPKMEVLYHIRPYFGGISPYIALI